MVLPFSKQGEIQDGNGDNCCFYSLCALYRLPQVFLMKAKRIYLIAGEASGDLHGSNLMKALLEENPDLVFQFWGGDRMNGAANGLVKHIRDLAFMGFTEVLMNLRTILSNISFCKKDILVFKPDALVLIDYPGFNLRIAEWAKKEGIKVYYYISPQVWAWKESRVKKIKANVDHMFVILPFETEFYKKHRMNVEFVGHPLIDAIDTFLLEDKELTSSLRERYAIGNKEIIALLPGSRSQEIKKKLPIMLKALEPFAADYAIVIAGAPTQEKWFYRQFSADAIIIENETYSLLSNASYAVVTSGTATLETALFKVPEVVCYKGSPISYLIAKSLIKIKFISLVNLIMDKEIVKELIQDECNPENIHSELSKMIGDAEYRNTMKLSFEELRQRLGESGASKKVARSLLKTI